MNMRVVVFLAAAVAFAGCSDGTRAGGAQNDADAAVGSTGSETTCGDLIVDTKTNPLHCGACDMACATGESCLAGACTPPNGTPPNGTGDGCGAGTSKCGVSCVSLQQDEANCGSCGTACGAEQSCQSGTCTDNLAGECSACDSSLANTCDGATCKCGDGAACTEGSGNRCREEGGVYACRPIDSCGGRCTVEERCIDGMCTCGGATCGAAELCCAGTCTPEDASNCGECGRSCAGFADSCVAGECRCGSQPSCTEPEFEDNPLDMIPGGFPIPFDIPKIAKTLGESCCAGSCIANDAASCGCGVSCGADEACLADGPGIEDFIGGGGDTGFSVCCQVPSADQSGLTGGSCNDSGGGLPGGIPGI